MNKSEKDSVLSLGGFKGKERLSYAISAEQLSVLGWQGLLTGSFAGTFTFVCGKGLNAIDIEIDFSYHNTGVAS